ncbi:hypothetical protein DFA_11310 [Cavenderia fasciculata]|uniref:Polyketide synthase n=1 Tax=Cavenderia fasciculata TaxID=261658 RepID=F4QC62_CACFS|nr:uncharacterized protein DFA_11310 [Cavenderia fasciculata]EGG13549.1 hypothetical protein DFA_11310 [Cavenderia fasciculata]|eukprot:XP_004350253.1 hypothetical protein DFA_11310 [Cavenderia fasciculata]
MDYKNNNNNQQQQQQDNNNNDNDIAIIGMGCRLPGGSKTPQEFWNQLVNGLDGISQLNPKERWSKSYVDQGYIATDRSGFLDYKTWTDFDKNFFGILPKDAAAMDPQVRVALMVLWEALEDAHIDPISILGSPTSTFIGQMFDAVSTMQTHNMTTMSNILKMGRSGTSIKCSYCFDFRGSSLSIDTACSSSLIGVLMAVDTIRKGDSDIAIAGGMNAFFDPINHISFTSAGMLGKSGKCASFDSSADGYCRSEGVAMIVLKKLSRAIEDGDDIYCVIKGGSYNVDGNFEKSSPTSPSSEAQQVNTKRALYETGLSPSDIYYIECHGTGTPTGDPIEIKALGNVFKGSHSTQDPLRIGSVKSNIGHTESTAGVAALIKCAMMLKNRMLVKNIHFNQLNPKIDLLNGEIKIVLENEPFPDYDENRIIRMGINSFGITGSNSHIIIQEYKNNNNNQRNHSIEPKQQDEYLIPLSTNSKKSMDLYIDMIKNNTGCFGNILTFKEFVLHQSLKANQPAYKKVIVAKDWDSFINSTKIYDKPLSYASNIGQFGNRPSSKVVMVFCGQGAQWNGMGKELYDHFQVFRDTVNLVDQLLSQHYNYSILGKLCESGSDSGQTIHHPILAQPSTFIIQVALVKLYQYFGINPSIVVGHSFGDVTAAWCSGIVSLEEAARIVYLRSEAQNATIGSGRMLSVSLSHDKFNERFQQQFDDMEVACYNAEDSIVLAGDEKQLRLLDQQLKADNIFSAFLGTPCAFHSSQQESTKEFIFKKLNNNIKYECDKPTIPYFSTTTSRLIESSSEFNAQSIFDNLRQPVLFQQAINNIISFTNNNNNQEYIYLEIAPHSTLSFYLKTLLSQQKSATILSPLNRKKDEVESIQSCLASLYFAGANVCFRNQVVSSSSSSSSELGYDWKHRARNLPRYQWDTEYLWEEQPEFQVQRLGGVPTNLLGFRDHPSLNTYECAIDIGRPSYQYLKGHKVKGKYLFPGAGYIENIINAFSGKDIHIHRLEFISPFFLVEGVQGKLKSTFTTIGHGSTSNDYNVMFQYFDTKSSQWIKSAIGRITVTEEASSVDCDEQHYDNVELLQQQYTFATMNHTDVYDKLIKVGLPYGETFQRVQQVRFNQHGDSMTQVDSSPRDQFQANNTILNASVLDCILHANLVSFKGEHPSCEIVFDRIHDMTIYAKNIPLQNMIAGQSSSLYSVSRSSGQRGNEFRGSSDIIDCNGTVIATCGSVVCRSLTKILKVHTAKDPSRYIYKTELQPKNSPSLPVHVVDVVIGDISTYLESFVKASVQSSHKVIRILDTLSNDMNSAELIGNLNHFISESVPGASSLVVDYHIVSDDQEEMVLVPYLMHAKGGARVTHLHGVSTTTTTSSLLEQGLLPCSYDLILSNDSIVDANDLVHQLHRLLNPNGQILVTIDTIDNSGSLMTSLESSQFEVINNTSLLICRKQSIQETINNNNNINNQLDSIIFITSSSSSSSSSSSIQQRLIEQANNLMMIGNMRENVTLFSSDNLINDDDNNQFKLLLESIKQKRSLIIYLESLEEMTSDNLVVKTMQHLKIHQIIRKAQIEVRMLTLIDSPLNECLIPNCREYQDQGSVGLFEFDSIPISMDKEVSGIVNLDQLLALSNSSLLGDKEFTLVVENNNKKKDLQVMVEREFKSPLSIDQDERFTIKNDIDLKVSFEKDYKYHLRGRCESLSEFQVEVKVKASSLNIRDTMILNGSIKQDLFGSGGRGCDSYNPPLGQDLAGIVSRVGNKVTKFKVGDEVYTVSETGSLSSHVIVDEKRLLGKPVEMTFVQAASFPSVFGIAYCALFKKASLQDTDSILIHSAAGAVGLAILNLLKCSNHQGKVFVTCSPHNPDKSAFLNKHYGSLITSVLSSTTDFTKKIKQLTDGKGVQVIINTLDRSKMQCNLRCLSSSGVVVDLTIVDRLDMDAFNQQQSYHSLHNISFNLRDCLEIQSLLTSKKLNWTYCTVYSCQDIHQALELVQSRKSIGKVVIDFENVDRDLIQPMWTEQQHKKPIDRVNYTLEGIQDTLLITGQTGMSVECLQYVIKHSPQLRDIIVLSFSAPKYEIQLLMNQTKMKNHDGSSTLAIHYIKCDVGNYSALESSIVELYKTNTAIKPVKTVIHTANFYHVLGADSINLENHNEAMSAKAVGAYNLHNLFVKLGWQLCHFQMLSSVATLISKGNTSYGVGNAFLDGLAKHRRQCGLAATSINWGSIGSTGKVSLDKGARTNLGSLGLSMLPLSVVYGVLRSSFISQDTPFTQLRCFDANLKHFVSAIPYLKYRFTPLVTFDSTSATKQNNQGVGGNDTIESMVIDQISDILSIQKSLINTDTKLKEYGVDSMVAIQIKSWIEGQFNKLNLFNQSQISNSSINMIIDLIKK